MCEPVAKLFHFYFFDTDHEAKILETSIKCHRRLSWNSAKNIQVQVTMAQLKCRNKFDFLRVGNIITSYWKSQLACFGECTKAIKQIRFVNGIRNVYVL